MRNGKTDDSKKEYSTLKMIVFFIAGLVAGFLLFKFVIKV
jgi:hypothetical protein